MNRRSFLKLIAAGAAAETLDLDKLLWIPGQKTIFLPTLREPSISEILVLEYERILPEIARLFERDDTFYKIIKKGSEVVNSRPMRIPLIIKPGSYDE